MISENSNRRNLRVIATRLITISFAVMILSPSLLNINNNMTVAVAPAHAQTVSSGEPLLLSEKSITRSFTYPTLQFKGQTVASLTQTVTWNTDGTTQISDSRGYQYSIGIPLPQGTTFSLLQNSTMIDQKVVSTNIQYDIYWKLVQNSNGYTDKYKFTIVGTSINGSTISFNLNGGKYFVVQGSKFLVTRTASTANNVINYASLDKSLNWTAPASATGVAPNQASNALPNRTPDGLGLDWSDAIAAGYQMQFDSTTGTLSVQVGKSFSIDPTIVATSSYVLAPDKAIDYEGERRIIKIDNTIFAFYYDGSNIVYKTSTDNGNTWSASATSTGSGTVSADQYRWSLATTTISTTKYISVLYWQLSGSNQNFYALRGTVSGSTITWSSPVLLGYTATSNCDGLNDGACVAVAADSATDGKIYAAFRWISGGATTYSYEIIVSSDGGSTWSTSLAQVNGVSANRIDMIMTKLSSGKMLFAYVKYESSEFTYRVFDGTNWGAEQTTSGAGMTANVDKQISADSNSTLTAYIAYLTGGTSGTLKVARFSNTGTFQAFEAADSTLSHSLPSIAITSNNVVHIYTLSSGMVYDTKKVGNTWESPLNPFGTTFNSPNQLTASIPYGFYTAAFWIEGTSTPYNLVYATITPNNVVQVTTNISPSSTESYEGEKRFLDYKGTKYAFYYDGSNIVYKISTDQGYSWSDSATSTGSGALASDTYRWTITTATVSGTYYVSILYWSPAGTNMNFYALRGTVSNSGISWSSPVLLGSTAANSGSCGSGGACTAAVATMDSNNNIYAAFRWLSGGATQYAYEILESSDGGSTWSTSLSEVYPVSSTHRISMALTKLASGGMLFTYATYESSEFTYRVLSGSTWGAEQTTSGAGMTANVDKQISADSNSSGTAYIAYVTAGTSGTLKVARFSNTGTFQAFEAADRTLSHSLPSITVIAPHFIHIYTIANGKIYDTTRGSLKWNTPVNPYGTSFVSPDQLTSGIWYAGAVWQEGSASPYTMRYSGNPFQYQVDLILHGVRSTNPPPNSNGSGATAEDVYMDVMQSNTLSPDNPQSGSESFVSEMAAIYDDGTGHGLGAGYQYFVDNNHQPHQRLFYYEDGSYVYITQTPPSTNPFHAQVAYQSYDSTNKCYNWKLTWDVDTVNTCTPLCPNYICGNVVEARIVAFSSSKNNNFPDTNEFTSNQVALDKGSLQSWSSAPGILLYNYNTCAQFTGGQFGIYSGDNGNTGDITPPVGAGTQTCSQDENPM